MVEETISYVEADPCYGCRFAVKKSEKDIESDGIFARRFFCANMKRRDDMELDIIRAICDRDYMRAKNVLFSLEDSLRCGNGMMKVVDATITPLCYQKKERQD